jgi:hypothetical protein
VKVLNLDELAKVDRTVVIGGKSYDIREMSVEGFIEFSRMAAEIEAKRTAGNHVGSLDLIALMRGTVKFAIPDASPELVGTLNIAQLTKLVAYINGELDEGAEAVAAAATAASTADTPEGNDAKKS